MGIGWSDCWVIANNKVNAILVFNYLHILLFADFSAFLIMGRFVFFVSFLRLSVYIINLFFGNVHVSFDFIMSSSREKYSTQVHFCTEFNENTSRTNFKKGAKDVENEETA